MSDGEGLLAAILADPDEDTPRLMYADWLQENGDESRAEFIRNQITPAPDGVIDFTAGLIDEAAWATAGIGAPDDWTWNRNGGDGVSVVTSVGVELVYRRGFVSSITLPLAAFEEHAAEIFRCQPVTEVRLSDKRPVRPVRPGDWVWKRKRRPHASDSSVLPVEMWERARSLRRHTNLMAVWLYYPTPEAAAETLSAALTLIGCERAGVVRVARPAA